VDAAAANLDPVQHVEPAQPDRVDDEEVGGQDLVGALTHELPPSALAAARRRWQAMEAEHLAHGQVRAAVTDLEHFALDPAVSPVPVLAGEAEDEKDVVPAIAERMRVPST
jgi:hypothetical protein